MGREDDIAEIARAIHKLGETPLGIEPGRENARSGRSLKSDDQEHRPMSAFREGEPLPARFDWTFNLGHLGIIFTLVTGLGGLIWNESAARSILAENQAQDRRDINSLLTRGTIWQPKVEALERSNNVQDERIQNLSQSTADIRRSLSEIGVNMGQLREDMATVRARLGVERRTELLTPNDPKRGSP